MSELIKDLEELSEGLWRDGDKKNALNIEKILCLYQQLLQSPDAQTDNSKDADNEVDEGLVHEIWLEHCLCETTTDDSKPNMAKAGFEGAVKQLLTHLPKRTVTREKIEHIIDMIDFSVLPRRWKKKDIEVVVKYTAKELGIEVEEQ